MSVYFRKLPPKRTIHQPEGEFSSQGVTLGILDANAATTTVDPLHRHLWFLGRSSKQPLCKAKQNLNANINHVDRFAQHTYKHAHMRIVPSRLQLPGKLRRPGWRKGRWSRGFAVSFSVKPEFWVLCKPAGSSGGGEPKVVVISANSQKALLPRGSDHFRVLRTLRWMMGGCTSGGRRWVIEKHASTQEPRLVSSYDHKRAC